jgi:hypothetical protein
MVEAAGNREPAVDRNWTGGLRRRHQERSAKAAESAARQTVGSDGKVHPGAIFADGTVEPVPPLSIKTGFMDKLKQLLGPVE